MKRIALFDFDGTLTRKDSFITFALFACRPSGFAKALIAASPYLAAWKLGLLPGSAAKQQLFRHLYHGKSIEWFNAKCAAFAPQINRLLRHDTMAHLKQHLADGTSCYIVSASIANWIEPWAKHNGVKQVIATLPEVDHAGIITGNFASPNCRDQEKVNRIKQAIPDHANCEIWAYGDSTADRAMLNLAQHPIMM